MVNIVKSSFSQNDQNTKRYSVEPYCVTCPECICRGCRFGLFEALVSVESDRAGKSWVESPLAVPRRLDVFSEKYSYRPHPDGKLALRSVAVCGSRSSRLERAPGSGFGERWWGISPGSPMIGVPQPIKKTTFVVLVTFY